MIIHVGGARGVGKSVVLERVASMVNDPSKVVLVHASRLLAQHTTEKFGSAWGELNDDQRVQARLGVIEHIQQLREPLCILDSHYITMQGNKPVGIIPEWFGNQITCHIVVEAPAEAILSRRLRDEQITRPLDLETIIIESAAERREALALAENTTTPVYIVNNIDVDRSATKIRHIVLQYLT